MGIGCVAKRPDKAYCGQDINSTDFSFLDAEWAFRHYNPTNTPKPDPTRLWACKGCMAAIKADLENNGATTFGSLIDLDKSRL